MENADFLHVHMLIKNWINRLKKYQDGKRDIVKSFSQYLFPGVNGGLF